jgi:integrase
MQGGLELAARIAYNVTLQEQGASPFGSGRTVQEPRRDIRKQWTRLMGAAELEDLHVHDSRCSFGFRVAKHSGILAGQRLLRHSSPIVTSRGFTSLGVAHLREITEAVSRQETAEALLFDGAMGE